MNIILGATGQVGSTIIREIKGKGFSVRAVVRNSHQFSDKSVEVCEADYFNVQQLIEALKGGTTVFLLTPENLTSNDILGDTQQIVGNYKKAIEATGIKKVIGLSSIGAHVEGNTGNLIMSRILENAFDDLDVEKVFIRPSYYLSNWLGYLETVEQHGVLPTFFPEGLKIHMNSPIDVAKFIAKILTDTTNYAYKKIYELTGPKQYSSNDVADAFSKLLNKTVTPQSIPQDAWKETLMSVGFTDNTSTNLIEMTQTVIDLKTTPERENEAIKLPTSPEKYFEEKLKR